MVKCDNLAWFQDTHASVKSRKSDIKYLEALKWSVFGSKMVQNVRNGTKCDIFCVFNWQIWVYFVGQTW